MADFNKPATTDTYANYTSYLNAKIADLALGLDPANTTPTNVPTNAIRWNSANNRFEKYNGTTWGVLSATFAVGALTATSTATATAFIPTGSTAPANGMYLPAANTLAFASNSSERWRVDSSGNFVIGSTSPASSKFRVVGGDSVAIGLINGASYGVRFGSTASIGANIDAVDITGTGSYQPLYIGGSTLGLQTGGTTRAWIDASGNLGLGVTPSAWDTGNSVKAFQISQGALWGYSSTNIYLASNYYWNGTSRLYSKTAAAAEYSMSGGVHTWSIAGSGTAGNAITFTQAMTLDASGNLGVGTTSPAGRLHVVDSAGSGGGFFFDGSNASYNRIKSTATAAATGKDLFFTTNDNGNAGMYLSAAGNLLVGTTSTDSGAKMRVSYGSGSNGIAIQDTNNTNNTAFLIFQNSTPSNIGSVSRVGTTNAVIYNTTSDYRLKTVIGPVSGYRERIAALEPIEFEWNEDGTRTRGFLAHKFQESYAHSVTGEKDAVDADGNPVYQAMQAGTSEVIADLVALLQEQQAIIVQLQSDVEALKH